MLLDKVAAFPTVTLPKFKLEGATPNCPTEVPVPESGTETFAFQYFDDAEKLPVMVPLAWGVKLRVSVMLCPGESVTGRVRPVALKPLPVMFDL